MKNRFLQILLIIGCAWPVLLRAEVERIISNDLNDSWPLEHVYFDFKPSEIKGPVTCTIQGITRPTQEERIKSATGETVRLWTLATISPRKDDSGAEMAKGENPGAKKIKAVFKPGTAASGLTIKEEGDYYVIDNGTYQFKVRNYKGDFPQPMPIEKVPHWTGGMRVKGQEKWDGRARFEGPALMQGGRTEIVSQGPVHIDIKVTLYSKQPADSKAETTDAVPLTVGKQSFLYAPNEIPHEKIPKLQDHYEVLLRFVAEDPWIDVAERYHFPRDPAIKPWGFNQQIFDFGGKDGMPIDTAMWVRWFEWDKFGGNTDLLFLPAQMRPEQKGRPFTMLRPLWNQGPGGSQDFFLTSGGKTPSFDNKTKTLNDPDGKYKPDAPAIGIYATFPSKWVGPFSQTIVCRAENDDSGNWRLPMVPAEHPQLGMVPGMFYGQRAYGICVGPRKLFDDTGRCNGMVRRHTDWTLVALINKYILDWPRDPSKAGPHLLITKERLEQLRSDFKANKNTAEVKILREAWAGIGPKSEQLAKMEADLKNQDQAIKAANSEQSSDAKQKGAKLDALNAARKELDDNIKSLKKEVTGEDNDILRLIVEGKTRDVTLLGTGLWRERRYQDDFLNPTQAAVRHWTTMRLADLFAGGKPVGGADQAAMGYIVCDPDSWMGYRNGWMPGNPNFHTDKYMAALYIGGALFDHPHAKEWLEFAKLNFEQDARDVLLPPDGVGVECPGYSGYAMKLLLPAAASFQNLGAGNIPGEIPTFKGTGIWHRKLLTPVDSRIGHRHEAPIGDTHRWDSGMGEYFGDLARFFEEKDPKFASEMMSTWRVLHDAGVGSSRSNFQMMLSMDYNLPETKMDAMDWSSQKFYGFGAILRSNFGTPRETFVSYKAGSIRGHYHNDENSYHYYALGAPVSLDYNCSYHPRGDHAALHNSMTFGRLGTVMNNEKNAPVEAQEQLFNSAAVGAFVGDPAGDLVVSERKGSTLSMTPIEPDDSEFQREYGGRKVDEIVHRRMLMLVKHPATSHMTDYLVVRDETKSAEDQQLNIHLLARELNVKGRLVEAVGQNTVDMSLFISEGQGPDGNDPKIGQRSWHYFDEYMLGPEEYVLNEGETIAAWDKRMDDLMKAKGVKELPLPGFKPVYKGKNGDSGPWLRHIQGTQGQALMPPKNWTGIWEYGEYQKWLRIETKPGTPILWVLYPYKKGDVKPSFERVDAKTVRIKHAGETEEVTMDSEGGVKIKNASGDHVILAPAKLPPLGEIKQAPL